jgi:hypothetical protein
MTIVLNLKGRLGNHLFQYAILRNLSIIKGFDFYINLNISIQGQKCLLPYFNITNIAPPPKKIDYSYSQPIGSNHFDEKIFDINDNTLLDGHFENIEYFYENKEIIKNELLIKDNYINLFCENYVNDIIKDGSKVVGIHFRRGDVIQQVNDIEKYNEKCINFVNQSLKEITNNEKNITLIIFTGGIRAAGSNPNWIKLEHNDDINWVNEFILENNSKFKIFLSPGSEKDDVLIDYCLLTKCDYIIIPHPSTFSYMASYVNKNLTKLFMPNRYNPKNLIV